MQITLNQVEIEQAIANYVNDLVSVNEGMDINITLKATRGEEGTTALIDIVPEVVEPETPEPVAKPTRRAAKPAVKAAVTKAEPEPEEAPVEAKEEPAVKEVEPTPEVKAEEVSYPKPEPEEVLKDAEPVKETEAEIPAEKPKSLFANLRKPNNG